MYRRLALGCWLLAFALAAVPAAAQTAGELVLDVVPAWEGRYRAERGTEIEIRASAAPTGGVLRATLEDGSFSFSRERELEPGADARLYLPVRPSGRALLVRLSFGNREIETRELELVPLERPLLALVADGSYELTPWLAAAGDFEPLPLSPGQLPRTPEGYETIAGLVVNGNPLAVLAAEQRSALSRYLAGCGRAFALDPAGAAELAAIAGCGGRFVTHAAGPEAAIAGLREPSAALPEYARLRELIDSPPALVWLAAAFLGAYALFCSILVWRQRTPRWAVLLGLPPLAAGLLLAVWHGNAPETRLVVWLDQRGDEPAHYRAVLDVLSQGTGPIELALGEGLGLPVPIGERPLALSEDAAGRSLRWPAALFARQSFGWSGVQAQAAALELGWQDDTPRVVNRSAATAAAALLAHERRYYRVPSLAPDQSWMPAEDAPVLSRLEVPAPLTGVGETALLLALAPGSLPAELPRADRVEAWLLLRPGRGQGR